MRMPISVFPGVPPSLFGGLRRKKDEAFPYPPRRTGASAGGEAGLRVASDATADSGPADGSPGRFSPCTRQRLRRPVHGGTRLHRALRPAGTEAPKGKRRMLREVRRRSAPKGSVRMCRGILPDPAAFRPVRFRRKTFCPEGPAQRGRQRRPALLRPCVRRRGSGKDGVVGAVAVGRRFGHTLI